MATLTRMDQVSEKLTEGNAAWNLVTGDFKLMLLTAATAPLATNTTSASAGTEIAAGTGYTLGGISLTGKAVTRAAGVTTWDADNIVFASVGSGGFSGARYCLIVSSDGFAVAWADLGGDKTNNNVELTISFDAAGVLTIS